MAAVDLDRLDARLSRLQADQLHCLDGDSSLGIPKITGKVRSRRHRRYPCVHLCYGKTRMSGSSVCAASTRASWLKKAIGPWVLYRVENAEGDQQDSLFHRFSWEVHCEARPR
ncbi:hypothetical protein MRX96_056319 [Rhipicephalus microplus]